TRWLLPSGQYVRSTNALNPATATFSAQEYFIRQAEGKALIELPDQAALPPPAEKNVSSVVQLKAAPRKRSVSKQKKTAVAAQLPATTPPAQGLRPDQ
ncbi:MAG TPA: hypothetical protein VMU62_09835, partial [Acidobacteriaceae bacterium]|nr:hypothetical protein [Acidobacteriaceae bacterium]